MDDTAKPSEQGPDDAVPPEEGPSPPTDAENARAARRERFRARRNLERTLAAFTDLVSDKLIRQLLVHLTKVRAGELLDKYSDSNRDGETLILIGTSPAQVEVIRAFLNNVVVPELLSVFKLETPLAETTAVAGETPAADDAKRPRGDAE